MAISTSPAAGTGLSCGFVMDALRANRLRLLGTIALAQLFVVCLLLVSAWPAVHSAVQTPTAGYAPLSGGVQLACLAASAMLGCMLALLSPAANTAASPGIAASWSTILAHMQAAVSNPALTAWGDANNDMDCGVAMDFRVAALRGSTQSSTTATRVRLEIGRTLVGLSGTTVARGLADTWVGLWGQRHDVSAFEVEAHRGRIQCNPTVLRQCVIHLLSAAAIDQPCGGLWQISVYTQHGERVATLHGQSSASQAEQVRARHIEASFALTLAEALIRHQGGSLNCVRAVGGRWLATISLPHS